MDARWLSKDARSFRLRPARFPLRVFLTCSITQVVRAGYAADDPRLTVRIR